MTDLKHNATQAILSVYAHSDQLAARVAELEALQGDQELWCVLLQHSGETLAMRSQESATKYAGDLNALGLDGVTAEVVRSHWPQDIHIAKAFQILEAWLAASGRALQMRDAEIGLLRGLLKARENQSSEVGIHPEP